VESRDISFRTEETTSAVFPKKVIRGRKGRRRGVYKRPDFGNTGKLSSGVSSKKKKREEGRWQNPEGKHPPYKGGETFASVGEEAENAREATY